MPARRRTKTAATRVKIRVPLPRQIGGRHEDKTRRPWRRRKHRKKTADE